MDYGKKYNEALEKARKVYNNISPENSSLKKILENAFPELKESEGEKIRKEILEYFQQFKNEGLRGVNISDWIAWLEKQGEKPTLEKATKTFLEALSETPYNNMPIVQAQASTKQLLTFLTDPKAYNPDSEVEPKFHQGEWITNGDYTWKIVEVKPLYYILKSQDGNIVDDTISHVDEQFRLWTLQDAKDGDVFAVEPIEGYPSSFVAIYKKQDEEDFVSHCFVGFDGKFCEGEDGHSMEDIHPATKEQRDALLKAIADAGYSFDFEKKELKKIEHTLAESKQETKPNGGIVYEDFNEDDSSYKVNLAYLSKPQVELIENLVASWQTSANNSVEWSEEDEKMVDKILTPLAVRYSLSEYQPMYNWLKSLKQRIGGAFIEKACEWIKYNSENGGCLFDGWEDDFKMYMKGE